MKSNISGFYKLAPERRRALLAELTGLSEDALERFVDGLDVEQANVMIENTLGILGMPLGLCTNMTLDGTDRLIPMAVEEASVVAAASHASKMLRAGGGVHSDLSEPHMIGQIQVLDVPDIDAARAAITDSRDDLLAIANACDPTLVRFGGGARDLEIRVLPPMDADDPVGTMLVLHLIVDVRDAMGANAINTMCERLAQSVEELTGGRVRLRILSNLADRRTVTVSGRVPFSALNGKDGSSGEELARGIEEASVFAERDPYRAATHNKGIMNGIDAVLIAFGQDWRAVEAGAHSYAARSGRYTALARWRVRDGHLHGTMTVPMAVGTVGGIVKVHPTVQAARELARVEGADDLAALTAAVGLAQNLGALRALAAEGIQQGHMRLHARNVAVEAGAEGDEIERVAEIISARRAVNLSSAREVLEATRAGESR